MFHTSSDVVDLSLLRSAWHLTIVDSCLSSDLCHTCRCICEVEVYIAGGRAARGEPLERHSKITCWHDVTNSPTRRRVSAIMARPTSVPVQGFSRTALSDSVPESLKNDAVHFVIGRWLSSTLRLGTSKGMQDGYAAEAPSCSSARGSVPISLG